MTIPVVTVGSEFLGREFKQADTEKDIPAFHIFKFKLDCYVPEVDMTFPAGDNPSLDANYTHYVQVRDSAQLRHLDGLEPGAVSLTLAITAKSTGNNSARPKYKVLAAQPHTLAEVAA